MTITTRTATALTNTSDGPIVGDRLERWGQTACGFRDVSASGSKQHAIPGRTANKTWLALSTNGAAWSYVEATAVAGSAVYACCQSSDGKIHMVISEGAVMKYRRFTPSYTANAISSLSQDTSFDLPVFAGEMRYDMCPATQGGSEYICMVYQWASTGSNIEARAALLPVAATSATLTGINGAGSYTTIVTPGHISGQATNVHDHGVTVIQHPSGPLVFSCGFIEAEMPASYDTIWHYVAAANGTNWNTSTLVEEAGTAPYCLGSSCVAGNYVYRARVGDVSNSYCRIDKIAADGTVTANAFPAFQFSAVGGDYSGWAIIGVKEDESVCYVTTYSYWNYLRSGSCTGGTWTLSSEPDVAYALGFGGIGSTRAAFGLTASSTNFATSNVAGVFDDAPTGAADAVSTTATIGVTVSAAVALNKPTIAGISTIGYSVANGTSVVVSYDTLPPIQAGDAIVLVTGQKPSTANSGSLTTPGGYTSIVSLTGAGGYGATLAADTGNTNAWSFLKDTVTGTESGDLTITVGTNSVTWAALVLIRHGASTSGWSIVGASASDTAAGNVSLVFGSDPGVSADDICLAYMVIPTDVTTPAQFTVEAITQTGVTFDTVAELAEADSGNGNDIGGFIVGTRALSGTSSAAPTVTATAGGTTTNVRGPGLFIRIRETTSGGTGAVVASATIGVTVAASLTGTGAVSATSTIGVSPAATASGTGAVSATSTIGISPSAAVKGTAAVGSAVSIGVAPTAAVAGVAGVSSTTTFGITSTAALTSAAQGSVQSSVAIGVSVATGVKGSGAVGATATIGVSPSSAVGGVAAVSSTSTFGLACSAGLTSASAGSVTSSIPFGITVSAALGGKGAVQSTSTIGVAPATNLTSASAGAVLCSSSIGVSPQAALGGSGAAGSGSSVGVAVNATIGGTGAVQSTITFGISVTSQLGGVAGVSSTIAFGITEGTATKGTAVVACSILAGISCSGSISGLGGNSVSSSAGVSMSVAGTIGAKGAVASGASIGIACAASLGSPLPVTCSAGIAMATTAALVGTAAVQSTITFGVSVASANKGTGAVASDQAWSISSNAGLDFLDGGAHASAEIGLASAASLGGIGAIQSTISIGITVESGSTTGVNDLRFTGLVVLSTVRFITKVVQT